MSGRTVATCLIFAAMLGSIAPAGAATTNCSLPIGQLMAAQFDGCFSFARDQAKIIPLPIADIEYIAPKPTTQRAYDALLHAGD